LDRVSDGEVDLGSANNSHVTLCLHELSSHRCWAITAAMYIF